MRFIYSTKMRLSFKSALKKNIIIFFNKFRDIRAQPCNINSSAVFVVGCGNSGTTLTATILSRHQDAFPIGYESYIFSPMTTLRCSAKIVTMIDNLTKQYNKTFFLEKTPKHALCISRIFKILPNARIIYVIRDGRDAVASLKKRYGDIRIATDRWITDNAPAVTWMHDERIRLLRFEDLVNAPEATMHSICEFLSIPFHQQMLESNENPYSNTAQGNMKLRARQVSAPIYNNTGKWKTDLSSDELAYFLKYANQLMNKLGYYSASNTQQDSTNAEP